MFVNLNLIKGIRYKNSMTQLQMVKAMNERNIKMSETKYVHLEKGKIVWKISELWTFCKICKLSKKEMLEIIKDL